MDSIQDLREKRALKAEELQILNDNGDNWTPEKEAESQKKFDKLKAEYEALTRSIERIEENLKIQAEQEAPVSNLRDIRVGMDRAEQSPFNHFGEFLQAVATSYRTSGEQRDPRLIMASTGMSEGVPSEGGFLIHKQFATEIYERIYAGAVLAPRTTRVPIGEAFNGWDYTALDESSRVTGVRHGGVRIYRLNEGGTLTASKLKFKRGELKLEKQIGLYYATDEQLKDSVALGAYMSRKFESAFAFEFDDEIFRGNGAGEPLGILNAGCLVSVAKETGQSAATIVAENIMKMFSRMYSGSLANAVWYVNQDCWPQIFQLHLAIGTGGVPLFIPAGQIANAPFGALLGRPIQPIEQASTLGTVGDIVFADFGQYITIDKGGLQADSSIHVQFLTDESTFRFILRNNGQPSPDWATALTPYKGSATVSPFVALAAR